MHGYQRSKSLFRLAALLLLMSLTVALAEYGDEVEADSDQDASAIGGSEAALIVQSTNSEDVQPPAEVHQDEAAAFAQDAKLMATQGGLPLSEVESALAFQDAFTMYGMDVLLPRYEDEISAIWVDPAPATRGYVRFVAEVPELARSEAASRDLDVVFIDGGEISMAEHAQRSELVADVLVFNGYQNFICGPDHKTGLIEIEIRLPEGTSGLLAKDLALLVQEYVDKFGTPLDGRAAEIHPADLVLILVPGSGPLVQLD